MTTTTSRTMRRWRRWRPRCWPRRDSAPTLPPRPCSARSLSGTAGAVLALSKEFAHERRIVDMRVGRETHLTQMMELKDIILRNALSSADTWREIARRHGADLDARPCGRTEGDRAMTDAFLGNQFDRIIALFNSQGVTDREEIRFFMGLTDEDELLAPPPHVYGDACQAAAQVILEACIGGAIKDRFDATAAFGAYLQAPDGPFGNKPAAVWEIDRHGNCRSR